MIWKSANLDGIDVAYQHVWSIIHGLAPSMKVDEIVAINNLKHGWEFLFQTIDYPCDYAYVCKMNQIVGANLYFQPGYVRSWPVKMGGTNWVPDLPYIPEVKSNFSELFSRK